MARQLRKKVVGQGAYYHLYNRIGGPIGELPFTDVDKEKAFQMLEELSEFFLVELISACWMGNHFHILGFVPGKPPTLKKAAKRHNRFYGEKKMELDPAINPTRCEEVAAQMVDVSEFMRLFQQKYTRYINRAHRRRGGLWGDRFKSSVLEGSREALWNGVKYVELNPVRAGMVEDPADYRFCSWGRYCGSGKHPFYKNFCKHMRGVAELHSGKELSNDEVIAEFRGELARIGAWEEDQDRKLTADGKTKASVAAEKAREKRDSMPVRFLRRTRYWTDGAVIGSKAFVQEVGCMFEDRERIMKKQLSRGTVPDGGVLHCLKRLSPDLI
ncbi:hypothetical protein BVX99_01350 [bacterium F16]|nr:hypothetical protein BVX99_01350 [bacterium F16]